MHLPTRIWVIISLLCFVLAGVFWQLARRKEAERDRIAAQRVAATNLPPTTTAPQPAVNVTNAAPTANTNSASLSPGTNLPFRVSNTTKPLEELLRSEQAILLGNARIDSSAPLDLAIPAHLRAQGEPGSYIVQSRGPTTDAFRKQMAGAGARVVSYLPNNAWLVRATAEIAANLRQLPETQAVLPWEPYYKLEPELLALAVEQKPMAGPRPLNLLLFSGEQEIMEAALRRIGVALGAVERSPFGLQMAVQAPADSLVAIAQLTGVQAVERRFERQAANDLTRARVRVTTNTLIGAPQYLSLSGTGVVVSVNDFGVGPHPDLPNVTGPTAASTNDSSGHGTHVAGIIASSGNNGPPGQNVRGSVTNANFRGMAPGASIYSQTIDPVFAPFVSDSELQENAALTNAFISNNSWTYGDIRYSMSAALWDEAVRDAAPGVEGPQPLTLVFAGGNSSRVNSPGTAKNVITVGAVENRRLITNVVTVVTDGVTNKSQPWLGMTDSSNQVAAFSARGNVGFGDEGIYGRFKPDVVAPGTFVVSTRPIGYVSPTNVTSTSLSIYEFPDQIIPRGGSNLFIIDVPAEGIALYIQVLSNRFSPRPFPQMPIYAANGMLPGPADLMGSNFVQVIPLSEGSWYVTVGNSTNVDVACDVRAFLYTTNNVGDYFEQLALLNAPLNDPLKPYGFESGTSQAAPVVSGLLALIAEKAAQQQRTNSPALNKALLINGARALGTLDYQVQGFDNQQGWGLVNITNSLPLNGASPIAPNGTAVGPMVFAEQNPAHALVTGQSHQFNVSVPSAAARLQPLRVTLVWTDPPGNPTASVKLVNDLDLVVIAGTGAVYPGNNFPPGSLFTSTSATNSAGDVLAADSVNNVENVFLPNAGATNFTVKVIGRRVNVNSVTTQSNAVVQDYALVISSGSSSNTAISVSETTPLFQPAPLVVTLTNGIPLLDQRGGAQAPLIVSTNGATNQWRFYVVNNTLTNGIASNIAFAVWLPRNLSRSRTNGADLDLFVSTNPDLTNLNPAVIATSFRDVGRGDMVSVVISNAMDDTLYYAGVKSEDQQGGEFGIFAVSSEKPFSTLDADGNIVAQGYPLPIDIPDGDATGPDAALVFVFVVNDAVVQNVVVSNIVTHGSLGDLQGVLLHEGKVSVLNNNDSQPESGTVTWLFDDSDSGILPASRTTSPPGTLRNFSGEEAAGLWQYYAIDSAFNFTGRVEELTLYIQPREQTNDSDFVSGTILPGRWEYIPVEVPNDATNLFACVAPQNGPVEVYFRRNAFPSTNVYDLRAVVLPPGDCVNLTRRDAPPLSPGRYIIGYYNPNPTPLDYLHREGVERDLRRSGTLAFRSQGSVDLLDDAVTNSTVFVNDNRLVADARVGVRIDHPRVSDLVLHLVSPSGTRILLSENRGKLLADSYGFGTLQTNTLPTTSAGDANASTNSVPLVSPEGTLQVDYDFFTLPDRMTVYYDGALIFDSGIVNNPNGPAVFSIDFGPGTSTNLMIVMNEGGNADTNTAWVYTATVFSGYNYFNFTDDTNFTHTPVKFALPPFTNFNYLVTNYTTNGIIMFSDFDDTLAFPNPKTLGMIFSGWMVTNGDVDVVTGSYQPPPNQSYGMCVLSHTGLNAVDVDGNQPGAITTNLNTIPGRDYLLRLAYTRNPGITGCIGSTNASCARSANVVFEGTQTVTLTANPPNECTNLLWIETNLIFSATSSNAPLMLQSLSSGSSTGGVFFDTLELTELEKTIRYGIYYQPEEPLTPLRGEPAFGEWKLEVWDNRLGGAVTNGVLLAWRLNLAFVNTNPPVIPLFHGVTNCLTLASNETAYFVVNVPFSALSASNYITASAGVDLIYDGFGIPEITEPPSTFFLTNVTTGLAVISTNGWNSFDAITNGALIDFDTRPVIRPGRRYYLAVRNRVPATNDFCITVWFDRLDPDLTTVIPITSICTTGAVTSTNEYDYYSVDISPNALQVLVALESASTELDLYLTTGLPLPLSTYFFRASTNAGTSSELIDVVDYCDMVPSNRWYIAVHNPSLIPGTAYSLCVTQVPGTVRDLKIGGVVSNEVAASGIDYYRINILSNSCLATFLLNSGSTNLGLYAAPMELLPVNQVPTNTSFVSTNVLSTNQFIQLTGGSLTQGCWIIAVVNPELSTVSYLLSAMQDTNCFDSYRPLTNDVASCTNMTTLGQVDYYRFQASPDALQVVFEVFNLSADVDLYATRDNPTPFPGPTNFLFASTNLGTTNEYICVARTLTNNYLQGTWLLAVTNTSTNVMVQYCIRAVELREKDVRRLTNGLAFCTNNLTPPVTNVWNSGVHFYSLAVTGKTFEAVFELYNLTGNADLYVQYGLCVTNFTTFGVTNSSNYFGYSSTKLSTNREYLCIATNSMPVPLTNGFWYIAVVNRETNATNGTNIAYCLKATLHDTNVMTHFASAGSILCTNVGPTNVSVLDGVNYHVLRVSNDVLAVNFETVSMSDNVDIYVQRAPCLVNFASLAGPPTNYPYASTNLGLLPEWVCVATNSTPVPLEPGDWFVAVVNRSSPMTNVNYCLRATPITTGMVSNIVATTNESFGGKDICRTLGSTNDTNTALGVHYYAIDVPTNGALLELETINASGNVDLFLQYGSPCFPLFSFNSVISNHVYSSTSLGTNNEIICVTTNTLPFPLTNGLWYVAVVNRTNVNVNYCLRTRLLLDPDIYHLSNGLARCSSMEKTSVTYDPRGEVNYYVFHVSSNAVQATFETFGANGNVDLYAQFGPCLTNYPAFRGAVTNYPYLSTNIFTNTSLHFYPYASTNRGSSNEAICLVTNSLQVPLQEGWWYIAVVNRDVDGKQVDYCVRATEILDTQITTLTNNQPYYQPLLIPFFPNVANRGVDYYHYRVASNAIQLSVELFIDTNNNRNVDLYVKKDLCWIEPTNFTYASTHPTNHSEHIYVATNSMPVTLTNGDWYIAVVNRDTNFTATYTIRALEFLDRDILPLTNCVITPTNVVGTNLSYVFQGRDFFVFEVSTNAVQVLFEMLNKADASRFYVSRELPLPLVETNDYFTTNLLATNHWVLVNSNSSPAALAPGLWFMTVENHGAETNIFVRASELLTTNDVTRLDNASSHTAVLPPDGFMDKPGVNYHVFRVSSNAVQANFRLFGISGGNADLFISREPLPSATNFLYASTNAALLPESIILITNGLASPLQPGLLLSNDWFIAVVNRDKFPVTYTLCATEFFIGPQTETGIFPLANGVPVLDSIEESSFNACTPYRHYLFTVATNAVQVNFDLYGLDGGNVLNGDADLYIRRALPLPDDVLFDAASANVGVGSEQIILTAGTSTPLAPGNWFITVVNRHNDIVDYTIRATQYLLTNGPSGGTRVVPVLSTDCATNVIAGTNLAAPVQIDYYRFTVDSNSLRAQFELRDVTADLALIVSHGLPLPTLTNYSGISANMGNCDELITFISGVTNALGFTFETGDWYIGVVNTNSASGSYRLCVREFNDAGTNTTITGLFFQGSTQVCLTISPTLPEVSYYVVGKQDIGATNWTPLSYTLRADDTNLTWCMSLPSPYMFFDVWQGLAPKDQLPPIQFLLSYTTGVFTLTWTAPTNLQFIVEFSETLLPGSWTPFSMTVTSVTGTFVFMEDGTEFGPLPPYRFYRVRLAP